MYRRHQTLFKASFSYQRCGAGLLFFASPVPLSPSSALCPGLMWVPEGCISRHCHPLWLLLGLPLPRGATSSRSAGGSEIPECVLFGFAPVRLAQAGCFLWGSCNPCQAALSVQSLVPFPCPFLPPSFVRTRKGVKCGEGTGSLLEKTDI